MTIRKLLVLGLLGWMGAWLPQQAALAAEIEGVRFAEQLSVGDARLQLHGTGLLRYRLFIKGYVAALYLDRSFPGEVTSGAVLGDAPRRLEIEYFWSIPATAFADATVDGVSRNVDGFAFESLRSRIDRLNDLYEDIAPGDRYALTYRPGIGTELAMNGRRLGVIEGADFAAALFAIWLGDEALDESLRSQLLNSH
jgi:hypothetical protein